MSNFKLGSVVGVAAVIAVIIGLVVGVSIAPHGGSSAGGSVHNTQENYPQGVVIGTAENGGTATFANDGSGIFTTELAAPMIDAGSVTTLSATSTAKTLTAAQVCDSNVIAWDVTTTSSTLTLPSATNLAADCLDTNGDHVEFIFNATSASTTVVTITAGSGIDLIGKTTGDDLIDNGKQARISLWRVSASAMFAEVEELLAAD